VFNSEYSVSTVFAIFSIHFIAFQIVATVVAEILIITGENHCTGAYMTEKWYNFAVIFSVLEH
jgi:hypothetical protein